MKRIHIVGCSPRSGTTLITELMINCFNVDMYDEHETSIFKWPKYKANIYVTKFPADIQRIDYLLDKMKNLYVICMLRDPRDIIVSVHMHDSEKYWCGLKFWKNCTPHIDKLINHPRFILIYYEELIAKPDFIQKHINQRLPFLQKTVPFSQFHLHANPSIKSQQALSSLRPLSNASISIWKQHIHRIKGQIELHGPITDDLIKYGYERNNEWEKLLDDITPDCGYSHLTEFTDQKRLNRYLRFYKLKSLLSLVGNHECILRLRKPFKHSSKV